MSKKMEKCKDPLNRNWGPGCTIQEAADAFAEIARVAKIVDKKYKNRFITILKWRIAQSLRSLRLNLLFLNFFGVYDDLSSIRVFRKEIHRLRSL